MVPRLSLDRQRGTILIPLLTRSVQISRSRCPASALNEEHAASLSTAVVAAPSSFLQLIRDSYSSDPICIPLLEHPADHGYRLADGLLFRHGDRGVLVPQVRADVRRLLLHEAHDVAVSGHMGVVKTLSRLKELFYWPGMSCSATHYDATKQLDKAN